MAERGTRRERRDDRRPGQRAPRRSPQPVPPTRPDNGSRFTGRAAILIGVVVVLAVSYASSMRAYLEQRAHIDEIKAEIADRRASIEELQREKRRWSDEAFVRAQARERFGYLMPGETSYQVIDVDGTPLNPSETLPEREVAEPPTAWWQVAWESVEIADDPPDYDELEPLDHIAPPEDDTRDR
ncbi:FtsB family cell division protein [Nocardioides limicola]|uniref:FtsB family cell division protein n=1 Tax=Nocardioides limicola TaxID=2803368 RepID=UPI00193B16BB|nr:septum formation initiator family protein [Nocardioides sp. DJM-14]